MFEEVPRERRGLARWLLVHSVGFGQFRFGTTVAKPVVLRPLITRPLVLRPLAVGPFVLGGGMLLATVGGSVAVAAAATVLTASAIGSSGSDVPPRPVSVAGPVSATSVHAAPRHVAAVPTGSSSSRLSPASRPAAAGTAHRVAGPSGAGPVGGGMVPSASSAGLAPASSAPAVPSATGSPAAPAAPVVPPVPPVPRASGSVDPAPSSSGPVGNALVHIGGYNQASGRLSYQFAVAGTGGQYTVSSPQTFNAVLSPTASIVSGGTLCPPAGSSCTPAELAAASGAGFFAELAIDATGTVRSVVEVDEQATARVGSGSSSSPVPTSSLPS